MKEERTDLGLKKIPRMTTKQRITALPVNPLHLIMHGDLHPGFFSAKS